LRTCPIFGGSARARAFYVDATEESFSKNYRIYSYLIDELPALVEEYFPADTSRQAIMGHSMGLNKQSSNFVN
jgi:S-formylglutathione hydrolase